MTIIFSVKCAYRDRRVDIETYSAVECDVIIDGFQLLLSHLEQLEEMKEEEERKNTQATSSSSSSSSSSVVSSHSSSKGSRSSSSRR